MESTAPAASGFPPPSAVRSAPPGATSRGANRRQAAAQRRHAPAPCAGLELVEKLSTHAGHRYVTRLRNCRQLLPSTPPQQHCGIVLADGSGRLRTAASYGRRRYKTVFAGQQPYNSTQPVRGCLHRLTPQFTVPDGSIWHGSGTRGANTQRLTIRPTAAGLPPRCELPAQRSLRADGLAAQAVWISHGCW